MAVLFMAILNGGAAFIVQMAVESGQRIEVERQGKIVVSQSFFNAGISSAQRVAEATSGSNG